MITSFHLERFKTWRDTGRVALAPLTLLFGANSAGKSSLGHWLLALKQTAQSADRRRALNLGDERSLVDLGTFEDSLYGHDRSRPLQFSLRWSLPDALSVRDPLTGQGLIGDELDLNAVLGADPAGQPVLQALRYRLFEGHAERLSALLLAGTDGALDLTATGYRLVRAEGREGPLEAPEKFYRVSEAALARFRNAGFLADFALALEGLLGRVSYLGPLRETPRRIYAWSGDTPEDLGSRGEYGVAAILAAEAAGRQLATAADQAPVGFAALIAAQLQQLGVIHDFQVTAVAPGRREYEALLRTHADGPVVRLTDVGFGISQVLAPVVQAFYCPSNAVVWMEQPELHLHPRVQANLADLFIDAIHAHENGQPRNVQLIVESHSEHLLNRLQLRIAERRLHPEQVAIYFCSHGRDGARIERLRLDEDGEIANWPTDFFGDEMADIAGRTLAALRHRRDSGAG